MTGNRLRLVSPPHNHTHALTRAAQCTLRNASEVSCVQRFNTLPVDEGADCVWPFPTAELSNITTLCLDGGVSSMAFIGDLRNMENMYAFDNLN
jgi:hypothetical protein